VRAAWPNSQHLSQSPMPRRVRTLTHAATVRGEPAPWLGLPWHMEEVGSVSPASWLPGFAVNRRPNVNPETVVADGLNRHDSDVTSMRADPCVVLATLFRD
jgi:hypothetical protein